MATRAVQPEMIQRFSGEGGGLDFNLVAGDQRRVQQSLMAGENEIALPCELYLPDELATATLTELTPYVLLAKVHPVAAKAELTPQESADSPMVWLTAPASEPVCGLIIAGKTCIDHHVPAVAEAVENALERGFRS